MRIALATLFLACVLTEKVAHGHEYLRSLFSADDFPGDFFLEHDGILAYATLVKTSGSFRVGFAPADYSNKPSLQMWHFEAGGKIRSRAEETLCWTVSGPENLVVLAHCQSATGSNSRFSYDFSEPEGPITVNVGGQELCVNEYESRELRAGDCATAGDSRLWRQEAVQYFTLYGPDNGCINPTYSYNALTFATCDYPKDENLISHWFQDNGAGLIHSRIAPDMCMQAAHGNILNDGSRMRFYACNKDKANQKFDWVNTYTGNEPLKLLSRADLCVVAQGDPAVKDVSEIILKTCGVVGNRKNWRAERVT